MDELTNYKIIYNSAQLSLAHLETMSFLTTVVSSNESVCYGSDAADRKRIGRLLQHPSLSQQSTSRHEEYNISWQLQLHTKKVKVTC